MFRNIGILGARGNGLWIMEDTGVCRPQKKKKKKSDSPRDVQLHTSPQGPSHTREMLPLWLISEPRYYFIVSFAEGWLGQK